MISFVVLDAKDRESSREEAKKQAKESVTDVTFKGDFEEGELNGMKAEALEGEGTYEGKKVDLGIMVLLTPKSKYLMIASIMESDKFEKHKETLGKVFLKLQPLK